MCEPVSTSLLIASIAVSAVGAITAGVAAKSQGDYQANVANQNASLADQAARDALARGRQQAVIQARNQSQVQGQQQAALAANGVDLSQGSASKIQSDTALLQTQDRGIQAENAVRESKGYSIQSANYIAEGQVDRMKGDAGLTAGLFGAAGTILGGASQFGSMKAGQKGFGS